jgi:hypothetical protein
VAYVGEIFDHTKNVLLRYDQWPWSFRNNFFSRKSVLGFIIVRKFYLHGQSENLKIIYSKINKNFREIMTVAIIYSKINKNFREIMTVASPVEV